MQEIKELQDEIDALTFLKNQLKNKIRETDTTVMSKKQLQEFAMTLPPIRDDLWLDMSKHGFQTGSSMFGVSNPADIDWVCQLPAYAFIDSCCAVPCGKLTKEYIDDDKTDFVPLYGNRNGKLYNIICIGNQNKFDAWKETTDIMVELAKYNIPLAAANVFTIKWKRVRLFRALCDVLEPVKPLYKRIDVNEAWQYGICRTCGREANNFTCKAAKDYYLNHGVCERCSSIA